MIKGISQPQLQERLKALKEKQEKKAAKKAPLYAPMKGYEWNKMRSLPRNGPCICDSGKKFKKCCLDKLPPVVPEGTFKKKVA